MTAHTPGPWTIGTWRGIDDYGWTVDLGGDQRIVVHAQSAESEPNVDLIAAAPELLEALLRMTEWHMKYHGEGPCLLCAPSRAAIEKATGGLL